MTLKALTGDGAIDRNATEPYNAVIELKREYFTQKDDVLLRLIAPYTAAIISEGNQDLLISSHFIIIRVKREYLDPYYLKWWLSQNRGRFYNAASGIMGTISSGYVGEMEIVLPPISKQMNIGNLIRLAYREQQLLALLAEKKKQLINNILRGSELRL
jgi:restriction endonuclease S subunit